MQQTIARLPGILARAAHDMGARWRGHGLLSAWICLVTRLANLRVRLANRLLPPGRVECPCCGWRGRAFLSLDCGRFTVPQVACPHCHAHERHRFLHLYLDRRPPEFLRESDTILHFAPEPDLRRRIDAAGGARCISTDYAKGVYSEILRRVPGPSFVSDIHHLPLAERCVDGLFCLHVLEHVADDREAIANLYHVLRAGGEAVLMVPFMMDQAATEEYDAPNPELFDHVRGYSPLDFKHRLAPFCYEEVMPATVLDAVEIGRYKIPDSQVIYVCKKQGETNGTIQP